MWNPAKDPQEEKYQQKLEAILEEKHKVISDRSQQLINIIFVVLGAYAVILSAVLFKPLSISIGSNSTLSYGAFEISPFLPLIFLLLSLGTIFMALLNLSKVIFITNLDFKNKFKIEDSPIQTSKDVIHISNPVHLKDGKSLVDRNIKLFSKTDDLLNYNHHSVYLLIISLILFMTSITCIINTLFFFAFGIIVIVIMAFFAIVYAKLSTRMK